MPQLRGVVRPQYVITRSGISSLSINTPDCWLPYPCTLQAIVRVKMHPCVMSNPGEFNTNLYCNKHCDCYPNRTAHSQYRMQVNVTGSLPRKGTLLQAVAGIASKNQRSRAQLAVSRKWMMASLACSPNHIETFHAHAAIEHPPALHPLLQTHEFTTFGQ